jgi:murein DD-endopeptidase MepM/ murein hydrolase activator NlpD
MWNKWKASKLYHKLKEIRVNRALYVSSIVILLSLAVVLAITATTNRAKKQNADKTPDTQVTETPQVETPSTDETPTGNTPDTPTETIPELTLPVSGKLAQVHDAEVQVFSPTLQDWRVHLGMDITTEANAEVFAAADGTVKKIWEDPMMGWCIAISHSGDCITVYKNLAEEMAGGITEGAAVRAGQMIGTVGDSALIEIAEEPHLHMEMTVKGLQVDPLDYFSKTVVETLSEDTAFEKPVNENK